MQSEYKGRMIGPIFSLITLMVFIFLMQRGICIPNIMSIFLIIIMYSMIVGGEKAAYGSCVISIGYVIYFSVMTYHMSFPHIDVKMYKLHCGAGILNDIVLIGTAIFASTIMQKLKISNEALIKSKEQLEKAKEFSHIMIIQGNLDGKIVKASQSFIDFIGYSEKELIAMKCDGTTHPDDVKESNDKFQGLLHGEYETYEVEKRCIKKMEK